MVSIIFSFLNFFKNIISSNLMSDFARVDQWIRPTKIYDAHLHMFTYDDLSKRASRMGFKSLEELYANMKMRTGRTSELPPKTIEEFVKKWIGEMDKYGVTKGMTLPGWNNLDIVEYVTKEYSDRFIPFMMINPKEEQAFNLLQEAYSKYGIKGFKLYPPIHYYRAYEDFMQPFYEFANDHKMLITYHMGISIGQTADLRFMNPSDISPVARNYNKINILFAHFATGYLRELLFLMYHVKNVFAETSSSNRWMDFMPFDITLQQVYKKVIKAAGVDHLIFGTDSTDFPRGWRNPIYQWQLAVCNEIGLNQDEINGIFFNNLERLTNSVE